jgi:hypothetical protein
MIAETTAMKIRSTADQDLAHPTASDVQITVVFQQLGIVMGIQIVTIAVMSPRSIVNPRKRLALETFSLVTMATAFHEFTFAMVTTIAWMLQTKMKQCNATIASAMRLQSLNAKRTSCGRERNVSRRSGCAMVILIVWMEQMKTPPHLAAPVQRRLAARTSLNATMADVSMSTGNVTTTMIAEMAPMREKSGARSTRLAALQSLPA